MRIPLHQPHTQQELGDQVSDVEIHAREFMHTKRCINEILVDHAGQPYERIEHDTDHNYIMGANEAIEYGVVDRVVGCPSEGAATGHG